MPRSAKERSFLFIEYRLVVHLIEEVESKTHIISSYSRKLLFSSTINLMDFNFATLLIFKKIVNRLCILTQNFRLNNYYMS